MRRCCSALATMPAVVVEGPRACGKTWTGRRFAGSAAYLDERVNDALSAGHGPRPPFSMVRRRGCWTKWQLAPRIWNPMRRACDDRGRKGQFIITGLCQPAR